MKRHRPGKFSKEPKDVPKTAGDPVTNRPTPSRAIAGSGDQNVSITESVEQSLKYILELVLANNGPAQVQYVEGPECQFVLEHYDELNVMQTDSIIELVAKVMKSDGGTEVVSKLLLTDGSPMARFFMKHVPSRFKQCQPVVNTTKALHMNLNIHRMVYKELTSENEFIHYFTMFDGATKEIVHNLHNQHEPDITDLRNGYDQFRRSTAEGFVPESYRSESSFREIPDHPTINEIHSGREPQLEYNKIKGGYKDTDEYLDRQFRLLREDFVACLRQGIADYRKWMNDDTKEFLSGEVSLYHNVQMSCGPLPHLLYSKRLHLDIESCGLSRFIWMTENPKKLMHGTLVCLSDDKFNSRIFLATVEDVSKDPRGLTLTVVLTSESYVRLELYNHRHDACFHMLETKAFYESYVHVLRTLKSYNSPDRCDNRMPFAKYIVKCNADVAKPEYLTGTNDKMELKTRSTGNRGLLVTLTENKGWPKPNVLGFNQSQFEAYKLALTKELALIQGPPGTGKTYVGLQIMRTLVGHQARHPQQLPGPVLVVCYTNHALDQFLEGILDFVDPKGILRIGRNCKSEKLKEHRIMLEDKKTDLKESHLMAEAKKNAFKEKEAMKKKINEFVRKSSLTEYRLMFESTVRFIINHKLLLSNCDAIDTRTRNYLLDWFDSFAAEFGLDPVDAVAVWLEPVFAQEITAKFKGGIFYYESKDEDYEVAGISRFAQKICKLNRGENAMNLAEVMKTVAAQSLSDLSGSQRWRFYLFFTNHIRKGLRKVGESKMKKYNLLLDQLESAKIKENASVIGQMTVVGMTTTGAARYQKGLKQVGPPIVIVEEAAEVLESHIVASLSPRCQQLILIGDHEQLKPSTATDKLAKPPYNLSVSLFERLVKNNIKHVQLSTQHRMRPEISGFIKFIYPNIRDDKSVEKREGITGCPFPVWFYNHTGREDTDQRTQSKENKLEAGMLVGLCKYLLHCGYESSQITVITMYAGQLKLIKRLMRQQVEREKFNADLGNISVRTVDDFQGEECHIIILSLVRSDAIGFTGTSNRICVAMSRARYGLFVLGNLTMFADKIELWNDIVKKAERDKLIGSTFKVCCPRHPTNTHDVRKPADFFAQRCDWTCTLKMPCDHSCKAKCHSAEVHERTRCQVKCSKTLTCGHSCSKLCHEECTIDCRVEKRITFTRSTNGCTHTVKSNCHQVAATVIDIQAQKFNTTKSFSQAKCEKGDTCTRGRSSECLAFCDEKEFYSCPRCGVGTRIACSQRTKYICQASCGKTMPCGHVCRGTCGDCFKAPRAHILCVEKCGKEMDCGHYCIHTCGGCLGKGRHGECKQWCEKIMKCGHKCKGQCSDKACVQGVHKRSACVETCNEEMVCSHRCQQECGKCHRSLASVAHGTCKERCGLKIEKCGHTCSRLCHQDKPVERIVLTGGGAEELVRYCSGDDPCYQSTGLEKSPCGHLVKRLCHQQVLTKQYKNQNSNWRELLNMSCDEKKMQLADYGSSRRATCEAVDCLVVCRQMVGMTCGRCGLKFGAVCYLQDETDQCIQPCSYKQPCGHKCRGTCTACKDGDHTECGEPCNAELQCGHTCTGKCSDEACKGGQHKRCKEPCKGELNCGHACSSNSCQRCMDNFEVGKFHVPCENLCGRKLPCSKVHQLDHRCPLPCHNMNSSSDVCPDPSPCMKKVKAPTSCKHVVVRKCHQTVWNYKKHGMDVLKDMVFCMSADDDPLQNCNNVSVGRECFVFCQEMKIQKCRKCRRQIGMHKCCEIFQSCNNECSYKLPCGHQCTGTCTLCDAQQHQDCTAECSEFLECGHLCPSKSCSECRKISAHAECESICDKPMACGHPCKAQCHQGIEQHPEQKCTGPCTNVCEHDTMCSKKCGVECEFATCPAICNKMMYCGHICKERFHKCKKEGHHSACQRDCFHLLSCGHKCSGMCKDCLPDEETSTHNACQKICEKPQLQCSHICQGLCSECQKSGHHAMCTSPCSTFLACDHLCTGTCGECIQKGKHKACKIKCGKNLSDCHHICEGACYKCKTEHQPCEEVCNRPLKCSHLCVGQCGACRASKQHSPCIEKCKKKLECGHDCMGQCADCETNGHHKTCAEKCTVELECGHVCSGKCDECKSSGKHSRCEGKCTFFLPCSHECQGNCGACKVEGHPPCKKPCRAILACDHQCTSKICHVCTETGKHPLCTRSCQLYLLCGHKCSSTECSKCYLENRHAKCIKSCEEPLSCGHTCPSTSCASCVEKGEHMTCTQIVETKAFKRQGQFVCGHKATVKVQCPDRNRDRTVETLCYENCMLRCSHQIPCKTKCGEPCNFGAGHNDVQCSWGCYHEVCAGICNELCTFKPCSETCKRSGECPICCQKTRCFSLCGLPCITLCHFCDEAKYKSYLDTADVYIKLDCGHVIQSSLIKSFNNLTDERPDSEPRVTTIFCPRPGCGQPVLNNSLFLAQARSAKWETEKLETKLQRKSQKASNEKAKESKVKATSKKNMAAVKARPKAEAQHKFPALKSHSNRQESFRNPINGEISGLAHEKPTPVRQSGLVDNSQLATEPQQPFTTTPKLSAADTVRSATVLTISATHVKASKLNPEAVAFKAPSCPSIWPKFAGDRSSSGASFLMPHTASSVPQTTNWWYYTQNKIPSNQVDQPSPDAMPDHGHRVQTIQDKSQNNYVHSMFGTTLTRLLKP